MCVTSSTRSSTSGMGSCSPLESRHSPSRTSLSSTRFYTWAPVTRDRSHSPWILGGWASEPVGAAALLDPPADLPDAAAAFFFFFSALAIDPDCPILPAVLRRGSVKCGVGKVGKTECVNVGNRVHEGEGKQG